MPSRGKLIRGAGGLLKRNTDLGVGIGHPHGGEEGDIRVQMVDGSPHLYVRAGGQWYGINLSSQGSGELQLGDSTNYINVEKGNIEMTGKISLISSETQNVCVGIDNPNKGIDNVYLGVKAGEKLTGAGPGAGGRAENNVAIGKYALAMYDGSNTKCYNNVAIGRSAMILAMTSDNAAKVPSHNVGIGTTALQLVDGEKNVGIGRHAGYVLSTGDENTFVGNEAGDTITTGEYNIMIGTSSDGAAGLDNQIAIGQGVTCSAADTLRIGDSNSYVFCDFSGTGVTTLSATSDIRIKKDIVDTDIGLSFVNALRPIKYVSKNKQDYPDEIFKDGVNPLKDKPRKPDPTGIIDGFIGQEVKEAMDDLDVTFSGWRENESGRQMLSYTIFVVPLVKAVQELSAKIDTMQQEINNLSAGE